MNNVNTTIEAATGQIADNEVIARVLAGEKDLYAILVRRYNQRLYRVAMSIVNDNVEAEDIMQVAYIKAYEHLRHFEFRAVFSTWLTRILINESLLRLKKRKRSPLTSDIMKSEEVNQRDVAAVPTPLSGMIIKELGVALEEAIMRLPEKYRTVFIMREIEHMNTAETKECLGLSETNVKVRLNRAKLLLRDSLNHYHKQEELFPFHLSRCNQLTARVMQYIIES